MEVRYASHPDEFESYTTERTRKEFLVQDLFIPGSLKLVYSHIDRMVVGGACPTAPLELAGDEALGTDYFLERREMGVINVGGRGTISVDGEDFELAKTDCLYIGKGTREVVFQSADGSDPARFYILSGPAHAVHPTVRTTMAEANKVELGSREDANLRILNQYIHPGGVPSCNLVMGITQVMPGSVWNSMPAHTHERRMEVYFYFDLSEDAVLVHLMGQPSATRHMVLRNEQAAISPAWSIHAGAGTSHYSFVWGMVGDNQAFGDMDAASYADLK